jgi:glutamine synthetase
MGKPNKQFLEYIWLDGSEPQQLRSKTKVVDKVYEDVHQLPIWSFDGSSTNQAKAGKGKNTDCVLKPVFMVKDPFRLDKGNKLVLCEVYNPDGETPHPTNHRADLRRFIRKSDLNISEGLKKSLLPWFGWEQEYTLTRKHNRWAYGEGLPLGFTKAVDDGLLRPDQKLKDIFGDGLDGQPRPQGDYYCGTGTDNIAGRTIAEEHMRVCADIGLDISGINAEVMLGQWEYQIGPVTSLNGSDQLWISRYILQRIAEKKKVKISLHPKPMTGDWNGSGCHVNVSTKEMRKRGGLKVIEDLMPKLEKLHNEHMEVYGLSNDKRLTGEHETSPIHEFSYGYSTRDTSIRIPLQAKIDGKGYFEDRRPASNCDPYLVVHRMLKTIL